MAGQEIDVTGGSRVHYIAENAVDLRSGGVMTFTSGGPTSIFAKTGITATSTASTKYSAGRAQYWTTTTSKFRPGREYLFSNTHFLAQTGKTTLSPRELELLIPA